MDLLAYGLVLLSLSAALVSLSYVWFSALAHAFRATPASGNGARLFWLVTIVALGWPGALIYWSIGTPRSA